jgi:hypothetical protein
MTGYISLDFNPETNFVDCVSSYKFAHTFKVHIVFTIREAQRRLAKSSMLAQ